MLIIYLAILLGLTMVTPGTVFLSVCTNNFRMMERKHSYHRYGVLPASFKGCTA